MCGNNIPHFTSVKNKIKCYCIISLFFSPLELLNTATYTWFLSISVKLTFLGSNIHIYPLLVFLMHTLTLKLNFFCTFSKYLKHRLLSSCRCTFSWLFFLFKRLQLNLFKGIQLSSSDTLLFCSHPPCTHAPSPRISHKTTTYCSLWWEGKFRGE